MVEDPASGTAVDGTVFQEPVTVRVEGDISVETVAETTLTEDIS